MAEISGTSERSTDEALLAAVPDAPAARREPQPASQPSMAVVQEAPDESAFEPAPALAPVKGARPTFEELYISTYQSLVRLAFVLTGSTDLSEDLVQDCFVRLHRHYDRLDRPEGYAKQAVVNACRSHFRKAGRERDRRPLLYVVDNSESANGSGSHPGELHDVLLTLPYRQRAAVVLRFYADLSEIEIAEALGCRPGTVGSLIHRGLDRMRGVLEQ